MSTCFSHPLVEHYLLRTEIPFPTSPAAIFPYKKFGLFAHMFVRLLWKKINANSLILEHFMHGLVITWYLRGASSMIGPTQYLLQKMFLSTSALHITLQICTLRCTKWPKASIVLPMYCHLPVTSELSTCNFLSTYLLDVGIFEKKN